MNKRSSFQSDFRPISPYDALCVPAQKFVWELANELGTSIQLVACILLSMFAAAQVGVPCEVSENYIVRLSSYLACGAPPSTGKSPAIKRMMLALHALITKHILISKDEAEKRKGLVSGLEKRIKIFEKKISKSNSEEKQDEYANEISKLRRRINCLHIPISPIMGKMTIQSFVRELSYRGGRGFQIDPEGGVLGSLKNVAATEATPILQAWSNEPISEVTKRGPVYIDVSSFVFLCLWQSEPLCEMIRDPKYRNIGFPARILIHVERDLQPRAGSGSVSVESEEWYAKQLELAFLRALLDDCN